MKIRTKYCGIVDIEPQDVFEVWESEPDGDFTHTLRCRDVTGKYQHHVYSISTKAALRLLDLSGKAIGRGAEDAVRTEKFLYIKHFNEFN